MHNDLIAESIELRDDPAQSNNLGTRPEIIRLSRIIAKLDTLCDQVIMHTGQNYDRNLNEIFFEQLGVRKPDYFLGARGTFGEQIGIILAESERILKQEKPDR